MEVFVVACYWLSTAVFCVGLIGFAIWENACPSRYDRRRLSPAPRLRRQESGTPAMLEEVSVVA